MCPGRDSHGLRKLHLNNSVEDPSYFHEYAGAVLFRAAGVPAPRVSHAIVELNGRRLGLYILKEGFDQEFLGQYFRKTEGNLYDTGPGRDVDEALEKDQGAGPDDRSDLQALAAAAQEPDLQKRWQELNRLLDMDRFVSFMAMEVLAAHRDGYCLGRNNFRVYHDLDNERMVFFPHGMDQLFGKADATTRPVMQGLVARAVMQTPEGRRQYRARLGYLLTNTFDVPALQRQADAVLARLRPGLKAPEARALQEAIAEVKDRMAKRCRSVENQLLEPEQEPLRFERGVARPGGWRPVDPPTDGQLDQSRAPDGRTALHIRAGSVTSASWRSKVLLPKGRYSFQALVCTSGVEALDFGRNKGAGLRILGGPPSSPYRLVGDNPWTRVEVPFVLTADQEVQLICELRARRGEAWYELDSLRLERLE